MPTFHHLTRTMKATGPVWTWGSAFLMEQKVTMAATAVVARAAPDAVFLDIPLDGTISAYTYPVPMDITAIVASASVGLDTPISGDTSQDVTQAAHTIATTASVALV